ncbi:Alpha/Beta hydrolase protein [Xylaria flabelliformis]|nr:Alpha/Beta hydrolase protein [Xylaria flabelliformis]
MVNTLHVLTDGPECPTMDIVAIHGLNGHYMDTFTHKPKFAPSTMWLKDLLPKKIPGCRTMSFQYDASFNSMSIASVRDTARSLLELLKDEREEPKYANVPIVIVAHSLGGLITKQALAFAQDDYPGMADCTKGIVFFGTPHRGADAAHWAVMAEKIGHAVFRTSKSKFLEILVRNSEDLYEITEDFRPIAANYAIVSFYEEYAYNILGKVIVDKDSAIMGLPHEQKMMISGTHTSMCRFSKRDKQFDAVWKRIKRAADGVP